MSQATARLSSNHSAPAGDSEITVDRCSASIEPSEASFPIWTVRTSFRSAVRQIILLTVFGLLAATSLHAQQMFDPCRTDPNDLWNWQTPDPTCPICTRYDPPRDADGKFYDVVERTTAHVKYLFDSGQLTARVPKVDWSERPKIKWSQYDFFVTNALWHEETGYHTGGICAAGFADVAYGQIVVSYRRSERVAALVEWETWNFWLGRTGRTDWWDNWPEIVPDTASAAEQASAAIPVRHRATGH